jgi:dihydroorotase-like cyclic amidohydrolase
VRGKPVRTIVRGKTVYLDGKVVGEKGWGKQARAQYPS